MGTNNRRPVTRSQLRAELAKYPTKAELRAELKKFATKAELKAEIKKVTRTTDRLAIRIIRLEDRVARIEERMATKDDINRIMEVLDDLVGTYKAAWNKLTVHDQRIKNLEARVFG